MVSNTKLGNSFNSVSKSYDRYRPDYPQKLIDDIILYSGIQESSNILEIGTGSGLASEYFLSKGFKLTMLDISKKLIIIAKNKFKKYKDTKYIINSFEKTRLPSKNFDLIFSAQAFHWLDQELSFKKPINYLERVGLWRFFGT
ncbi:MAG: class I SAM-dependent methyltransferase [Patescibacteria group bacterium]|jgi:ubiquinone/menaquinone biosynthesis C-methylase UbiE